LNLLPYPRSLKLLRDTFTLPKKVGTPRRGVRSILKIIRTSRRDVPTHPEGYALTIDKNGIEISFREIGGLHAAAATLRQLLRQYGRRLPCLKIRDWPDFARRGVMLDISRGRVPKLETLLELVEHLADFKINEFQLYTEHTFAYRRYKSVWQSWGALTGEEIRKLDMRCRELGIDLVPNQNSFGHLRYFLEHPLLKKLAEVSVPYEDAGGEFVRRPTMLAPNHPGTLPFLRKLYDELLPNFSSRFFNVGCDETFDLGRGQSKKPCERLGKGRVYLDFLEKIHHEVSRCGKCMMFWSDIILRYPELIKKLPRDVIALNWGYEANHAFAREAAKFAKAKIPFYVCPGTSTWQTLIGRHDNALANLRAAAKAGKKFGAIGYLITDWGDGGHPQPLVVSYLSYLAGAAMGWCEKTFDEKLLVPVLSRDVFDDPTKRIAKAAFALGHAHRKLGCTEPNLTPLGAVIAAPPPEQRELFCRNGLKYHARISNKNIRATLKEIEKQRIVLATFLQHRGRARSPHRAENGGLRLVRPTVIPAQELDLAARMAAQSCKFMLWQQAMAAEKVSEAKRLAQTGISELRKLEKDFNAYWPMRNKATSKHCSAFLQWRMRDYLSGRAGSPLHAAGKTK
jgi:hexosaminidase